MKLISSAIKRLREENKTISLLPPDNIRKMRTIFFLIPILLLIPILKDIKTFPDDLLNVFAIRGSLIAYFLLLFAGTYILEEKILRYQQFIYKTGIILLTLAISIISAWSEGFYFLGIIQIELGVATFITMTRIRAIITMTGINLIYLITSIVISPNLHTFTQHLISSGPPLIVFALITMVAHHIIITYRIRDFLDNLNLSRLNSELQTEIEERKAAEVATSEAQKKLVSLNITKDKMFSIIAHDLRGPLGNINSLIRLFLDDHEGMSSEDIINFFEMLNRDTETTFQLLENLLLWARSQKGDIEPDLTITDLSSLIFESLQALQGMESKKNITITNNTPGDLSAVIDPSMIMTAMRNLISNAVKFTQPGGTILIEGKNTEDHIELSVKDSGIGMSEEVIKKIMSPEEFYSTKGTGDERGTGLGMKLCLEFVEAHHGTLTAKSKKNEGSIFTIKLPS